ncbi:N-glycosylase/DNA lyase, partial [bacterium]|nr:N-glycosylase/DNA lyase [bacterium]
MRATIEKTDHVSFQTDWVSSDPSRFPVRIKAAAYALFRKGCFGDYLIAHYSGTITIRYLKTSPIIAKQSVAKSIKPAELPEIKTAKTTIKQKQMHSPLAKEQLLEILERIPWKTWEEIVEREPEWHFMEPLFGKFHYGSFAVLMLITGLNDYQLKGKAEIAYWPKIHNLLKNSKPPSSPKDLHEFLKPFYKNERFRGVKLQRLKRFLISSLVHDLWNISPREVSKKLRDIWDSLAKTMEQNPRAKTICFAMKCLGLTLLMVKEYQFDFSTIPIPVDSRVMRFTKGTGISASKNPQHIREIWSEVLSLLRSSIPEITMIHLDSLIWQIASLSDDELESYFGS